MFAKLLPPLLGGSPSVWTACVLFFQSVLLAGYAYAHALQRVFKVRGQLAFHVAVLAAPAIVLPLHGPSMSAVPDVDNPVWVVLREAVLSVGLPFFVLATSAPFLQRWFSRCVTGPGSRDPYFLYAVSNAGSLGALMLYPAVLEPALSLTLQTRLWTAGYLVSATLVLTCAVVLWIRPARPLVAEPRAESSPPDGQITIGRRLLWLGLSFVPSSLMLAVTAFFSTDVAPVPLLWTVPLALYLLTFIATFGGLASVSARVAARVLPFAVLAVVMLLVSGATLPLWLALCAHLCAFLALSTLCHGRLSATRPGADHLTEFYLWLAMGGGHWVGFSTR